MSRLKFLLEALKNFREVGTITRSGHALTNKIASFVLETDIHVLELGAGDGAITRKILKNMHPSGKLLSFEINPNMYKQLLSIDDPRLIAINCSAEELEKHMKIHNISMFDSIVSAIPYIVLPKALALKILNLCKTYLKENKPYLQVHYAKSPSHLYKGVFGNLKTYWVLKNIPPAYVFKCIKK
ncbi:MAG: hypothetical protein V3V14_09640 [Saprospiraceae bacterium]